MIVSCCDSRVDPETMFSAMPGELFVVRNVANLVPPFETQGKYHGVSAALEFAALNLRVKHIVVLGHSGCGGVRACLEHDAARQTKARVHQQLDVDAGRARATRSSPPIPARQPGSWAKSLSAKASRPRSANLRTFPCIQILEGKGRIALHGAYFDIGTGMLEVLDRETGKFVPL